MLKSSPKFLSTAALAVSLTLISACVAPARKIELQGSTPTLPTPRSAEQQQQQQLSIAALPVEESADGWKVASADAVTLTVTAPGASEVEVLYRPVIADETDGYVQLKNLIEPTDRAGGKFQTNLQTSSDFAGQVWAQVKYPDGTQKQTEQLALTTRTALGDTQEANSAQNAGESPKNAADATARNAHSNKTNVAIGEDESARSDKATGGRVVHATLRPNNPDIRITVNVPAFLLTLWQNGKEVATYHIGIGRKAFPIPVGDREANRIILNPAWIPPDSSWVREASSVEPYERIPADDPRNPLGKIKIPLGDAYLIHEAAKSSDIGSLVSHGCVRMLTSDIFDLTQKIARARNLDISAEEINKARGDSQRRVINLDEPIPVDINYDTAVIEGGVLYLYPDVYERGTATIGHLRDELNVNSVDASRLDDATLREMLGRPSSTEKFVVKVSDVRHGRAAQAGRTESLIAESPPKQKTSASEAS